MSASALQRILLLSTLCSVAVSFAGCYDPELGEQPFRCAISAGQECPEGYACVPNKLGERYCLKGPPADAAVADRRILTDAELMPSKEGSVYLDGAIVKPATGCADKDVEPNNSVGTATPLTYQGTIPGWEICYPGDVDQFSIALQQGQRLVVRVVSFDNAKGDLDAALVDPTGYVIDTSRTTANVEELRVTSAERAGKYIVGVYGFGSAVNTYDLEITITN